MAPFWGRPITNMSVLRPEMAQVVAQSLGLPDLSDACVRALLPEVELRVREVVQDALKFRSHSKRPVLTTAHVNQALQARNVEVCLPFCAHVTTAVDLTQCYE